MKAAQALSELYPILSDDGTTWPPERLLRYLSAGAREVAGVRWDAVSVTETVQLSPGIKQTLPSGSIGLLDISANMGASGTEPGEMITRVEKGELDLIRPTWRTDPAAETLHFIYEPKKDPLVFHIWPKAPNPAHYVERERAVVPVEITESGQEIPVRDEWFNALVFYAAFRALSEDTAEALPAKAAEYNGLFRQALGLKTGGK